MDSAALLHTLMRSLLPPLPTLEPGRSLLLMTRPPVLLVLTWPAAPLTLGTPPPLSRSLLPDD